jgi:hypothetical protein
VPVGEITRTLRDGQPSRFAGAAAGACARASPAKPASAAASVPMN